MSIIVQKLTYIHPDKEVLFQDINLTVSQGQKIALIGNNGSGKSTLLQIIAGNLQQSSGDVNCLSMPYYVPQHFGQYDQLTIAQALRIDQKLIALEAILNGDASINNFNILEDDWNIKEKAIAALSSWDMDGFSLSQQMKALSGGEKTRVFLAGILIHSPDIILLDEPTNHLDIQSRNKLYDLVKSIRSTVLIISHDRTLLNQLPIITELGKNKITVYGGNYEFYKIQKEQMVQSMYAKLSDKEKELRLARKTATKVAERKQKHEVRGEKLNAKKGIGKMAMNIQQDKAEKSSTKLRDRHLAKMDSINESITGIRTELPDNKFMKIDFNPSSLHEGKILVTAKDINFSYNANELWTYPLNFQIKSGERIVIEGVNGSGKTTLLKLIVNQLEPTKGTLTIADFKYVYLDQEYSIIENYLTIQEQVLLYNSDFQEHEIKTILNRFLFPFETWNKKCDKLSGGEKMKLAICCLMVNANTPDIFILDEPTNNIDIQNIDILTEALKDYRGTILVISHDQYFIQQINTDYSIALS